MIEYSSLDKKTVESGKNLYLLGKDSEDVAYWLEAPSWDCGWYWGFGHIYTYPNNNTAKESKTFQHIDNPMRWFVYSNVLPKLAKVPYTEDEAWKLVELFKQFYLLRDMAGYYKRGGCYISVLDNHKRLQDRTQTKNLNNIRIPEITKQIINILKGA